MKQRNEIKDVKNVDLISFCIVDAQLKTISDDELDNILKTGKSLKGYDLRINNLRHKDLSGFEFEKVIFPRDFEFKNYNFEKTKFVDVDFNSSKFDKCNFESAAFERVACGGIFYACGSIFYDCNLKDSNWLCCNLKTADFKKSDLTMAYFDNSNLSEAFLGKTNMECVSFRNCIVEKAVFYKDDLTGSVIKNTSFKSSVFDNINYCDVSFINVDVEDARFVKCDFSRVYSIDKDCNFEKAKIEGVKLVINSERDITVEK